MKTPSGGLGESPVLAENQAPVAELYPETVEVRNQNGVLVARIEPAQASELLTLGWAEPIGGGCAPFWINRYSRNTRVNKRHMKYLRLTKKAPPYLRPDSKWMCPTTTQVVRADRSCKIYNDGQLMSGSQSRRDRGRSRRGGLEHKPLAPDQSLYQPWRTVLTPK